ncbi:MAG: Sensor histidine kinase RcsC [Myxococcota bacterium]|nr:Sensor histidine kinase RcsC [Myxococcota bacterium]
MDILLINESQGNDTLAAKLRTWGHSATQIHPARLIPGGGGPPVLKPVIILVAGSGANSILGWVHTIRSMPQGEQAYIVLAASVEAVESVNPSMREKVNDWLQWPAPEEMVKSQLGWIQFRAARAGAPAPKGPDSQKLLQEQEETAGKFVKTVEELVRRESTGFLQDLANLLKTMSGAMNTARVSFWTLREEPMRIVCDMLYDQTTGSFSMGHHLLASQYPRYFKALQEHVIIPAHDAATDPRTSEFTDSYLRVYHINSMLDIPVHADGLLSGVLCIEHTGPKRIWTIHEQQFAVSIGQLVARHVESEGRRKTQQALMDSEEMFRLLVESVNDTSIILIDTEGRIISWNTGAERITHYSAAEMIGKHWSILRPETPGALDECRRHLDEALRNGRFVTEGVRVRKGGIPFRASITITPLFNRQKQHRGFAKITREIQTGPQAAVSPAEAPRPVSLVVPSAAAAADVGTVKYPYRVLLVEDNLINQRVVQLMLQNLGCTVDTAADGISAVQATERGEFDLVLMDVHMPEMDGLEATRCIRALRSDPEKPLIVGLSATSLKSDVDSCFTAGMNDFIDKPADMRKLRNMFDKWGATLRPRPVSGVSNAEPVNVKAMQGISALPEMETNDMIRGVYEAFLNHLPTKFAQIRDSLERGNLPQLRQVAHSLKGASAQLGCAPLSEVSARIEQCAAGNDIQAVRKLIPELERESERARLFVQDKLASALEDISPERLLEEGPSSVV